MPLLVGGHLHAGGGVRGAQQVGNGAYLLGRVLPRLAGAGFCIHRHGGEAVAYTGDEDGVVVVRNDEALGESEVDAEVVEQVRIPPQPRGLRLHDGAVVVDSHELLMQVLFRRSGW